MQQGSLIKCIENYADQIGGKVAMIGLTLPKIGAIYTCDGFDPQPGINQDCIFLAELKQYCYDRTELSYRRSWFVEVLPPFDIANELFSHAPETCEA